MTQKVDEAQANAMRQYAIDHDRFAAEAIELQRVGRYVDGLGARSFAARIMRAYEAERKDPVPEGLLPKVDG